MKVYRPWLQKFVPDLPEAEALANALTFHAFEIESVEGEVLDVKITPNRGHDALSHRGIAKELAAILKLPITYDPLAEKPALSPVTSEVSVSLESPLCKRYIAGYLKGVKVGPSPEWLRESLEAIGQRSINNVVDATNFVMFKLGQPLHAFDAKKLPSLSIGVRTARKGEEIETLDNRKYSLTETMLLITAGDVPVGIAGIKGGIPAAVDESTTDIIIESANFDGPSVRKTSRALVLRTDASSRFEQVISPELAAHGMADAVAVIQKVAGGELAGFVDVYPAANEWAYKVGVSAKEVNILFGSSFSESEVEDVFKRFGWTYRRVEHPALAAVEVAKTLVGAAYKPISGIRTDAPRAFSCSSFTNYVYVLSGIAMPSISVDQYVWGERVEETELEPGDLVFSNTGKGRIYTETEEYKKGTSVPEGVDHVALYLGEGRIVHANMGAGGVVIEELASAKIGSVSGYRRPKGAHEPRFVVTVPFERLDLRTKEDLIEEVGRVIGYERIAALPLAPFPSAVAINGRFIAAERAREELKAAGYSEVLTSVFVEKGERAVANKIGGDKPYLRATLIDGLKEALARNLPNKALLELKEVRLFEIGIVWKGGKEVLMLGKIGEKEPASEEELQSVAAESYEAFPLSAATRYEPFSRYPYITRDIALWVPAGTGPDEVHRVIEGAAADPLLLKTYLFDRFEKAERVSYAFRLIFQSFERTLSDEDANTIMEKVSVALKERGWEVR